MSLRLFQWDSPWIWIVLLTAPAAGIAATPPCALDTKFLRNVEVANVLLQTVDGEIEVQVDLKRAPKTACNFLKYVENQTYDGGFFGRTVRPDNQERVAVPISVIQAYPAAESDQGKFGVLALERTRDTGLHHVDGTLSMARATPDSATSQFFICVGNQPELDFGGRRNPDGQGFAAFGHVVRGMDVVRKVHGGPAEGERLIPPVRIVSARIVPKAE